MTIPQYGQFTNAMTMAHTQNVIALPYSGRAAFVEHDPFSPPMTKIGVLSPRVLPTACFQMFDNVTPQVKNIKIYDSIN